MWALPTPKVRGSLSGIQETFTPRNLDRGGPALPVLSGAGDSEQPAQQIFRQEIFESSRNLTVFRSMEPVREFLAVYLGMFADDNASRTQVQAARPATSVQAIELFLLPGPSGHNHSPQRCPDAKPQDPYMAERTL